MGVLAALVFIGIVTAAMVKNTGSQSAVSRGYGAVAVMGSTARSGVVATEGFFLNNDTAVEFINKLVNQGGNDFLFNSGTARKRLSASANQYFSSQLYKYDATQLNNTDQSHLNAGFKISAGKNASGKAMKEARAFYRLGNLVMEGGSMDAQNAIYSKGAFSADAGAGIEGGSATFDSVVNFNGNSNDITFTGSVYFNDTVKFQGNSHKFQFDSTVYFNGYADIQMKIGFKKWVYFNSGAKLSDSSAFDGKAYFGGLAWFSSNGPITFKEDVGFNGNIETNLPINTQKHIYINGSFTSNSNGKFDGANGVNDTLFHTNNFNLRTDYCVFEQNVNVCDQHNTFYSVCQTNNRAGCTQRLVENNTSLCQLHYDKCTPFAVNAASGVAQHLQGAKNNGLDNINITQKLNINTAGMSMGERKDPQLDITKIPQSVRNLYTQTSITNETNTTALDMNKLDSLYANAPSNARYMGHIVIRVTGELNTNHLSASDVFNGKVIFIIESGGTIASNGNFYTSTSNDASTLIYAAAGTGQISQFGTTGTFRGYIYIANGNTANNSINFTSNPNGKIIGAIHNFSNKQLEWNAGFRVPVQFSPTHLNAFAGLKVSNPSAPPSANSAIILTPDSTISVKPLGYYFY
ncbi:MAG: hypothetical protein LBB74_10270 [Chitinispirillales bacterium]|nr:hypothetical protein [Chitinispirillales bacterium]